MQKNLLILMFLATLLTISVVHAIPPATLQFDQSTYRPGTGGMITVTIFNNEGNDERNFQVCFTATQYVVPTSCGSITYLTGGSSGTTTIQFQIPNEASSPNSYPIQIYYNYEYKSVIGWLSDTGKSDTSVSVSGISIKDEANQKITQLPALISSAQSAIRDLQSAITNAQSSITSAQSVGADLTTANNYLSSAKDLLSRSQEQATQAQNNYNSAQNSYSQNSYSASLQYVDFATTSASSSKDIATTGYNNALSSKSFADSAREEAIRQNNQRLIDQQNAENQARQNTIQQQNTQNQQNSQQNESNIPGADYTGSYIFLIVLTIAIVGVVVYFLTKSGKKSKK